MTQSENDFQASWKAGRDWAQGLRVGDEFLGCSAEALARGLKEDAAQAFWLGAFELVNTYILYTGHGGNKITRLERPEERAA